MAKYPNTLYGTRRRLRQRMAALDYVLDPKLEDAPDEWGDEWVFAHVRTNYGLGDRDKPTIQSLAALARAARADRERTLVWALFAQLAVRKGVCEDAIREVILPVINARCELGLGIAAKMKERLDQACAWFHPAFRARALPKMRNQAKNKKLQAWLAPSWYLMCLQGKSVDQAIGILQPGDRERDVREICVQFDKLGKVIP